MGATRSFRYLKGTESRAKSRAECRDRVLLIAGMLLVLVMTGTPRIGAVAADGLFVPASSHMLVAAQARGVTLLPDGKVLLTGGYNGVDAVNDAEMYDPTTGTFVATGTMATAREWHTATLLHNGKVLIAGGYNRVTGQLSSAELYDPATGHFSATGVMTGARMYHTATLLPSGKVLIVGGFSGAAYLRSAEVYDPATETFSVTASMLYGARELHSATLLPDGKVLIAGGFSGATSVNSAELYDPDAGIFTTTMNWMSWARYTQTATLLNDGKVLMAGGWSWAGFPGFEELYDPATGYFVPTGTLGTARNTHTASLLPDGRVLIAGGYNSVSLDNAELYDPDSGTFTATASMADLRMYHMATVLQNGKVLVAGGFSHVVGNLNSAELYLPRSAGPYLGSISPNEAGAGAAVTLRGYNLGTAQGTSSVRFNGVDAGIATSWADEEIVVTVPLGATSGPVVVTVNGTPSNGILFTVLPSPDLSVFQTDSPDPVVGGASLAYTITVGNSGSGTATGVVVTDTLPVAGVNLVSASPSQGTCSGTSTVTCKLGTINSGEIATVIISVNTTAGGRILSNSVAVSANEADIDPSNNTASEATVVLGQGVDLIERAVSDPPANAVLKGKFAVTDSVMNVGGSPASASTTRYYLSPKPGKGKGAKALKGARSVEALAPGAESTGTTTVTLPAAMNLGYYYLVGCADDLNVVAESNELNNCTTSANRVLVGGTPPR